MSVSTGQSGRSFVLDILGSGGSTIGSDVLPAEMRDTIHSRLRFATLLISAIGLLFLAVMLILARISPSTFPAPTAQFLVQGSFLTLNVMCYLAVRHGRLSSRGLLNVGLIFEVGVGLIAAVFSNLYPWPETATLPSYSPVAVWVIAFPLVIPAPPKRAFIAAVLTAMMDPLTTGLLVVGDLIPMPPPGVIGFRFLPNVAAVFVATAVSRYLFRMGTQLAAAREFGSYQLEHCIGRGGMGEVWRAQHRLLARPAAIKLIRPEQLGDVQRATSALQRFEREARATANLRSPHTIEVYDFGLTHDGAFYYVMELLDGINLDTLVAQHGPLPAARVVHILTQACASLAEAHAQAIVHRDIKPANIFLCRHGLDYDFVKVLDFGLVLELDTQDQPADAPRLTKEFAVAGTPAFMAPEQAQADTIVGPHADLYALGCVAYWLLTGTPPFDATDPVQVMIQHVRDTPESPSQRLGQPLHPGLEAIVMQCLAKAPMDRPAHAHALAQSLLALPDLARWTPHDASLWWQHAQPGPTDAVNDDSLIATMPLIRQTTSKDASDLLHALADASSFTTHDDPHA